MLTEPNQKRWQMAFAAIYCTRAFSTPLKNKKSPVSSTSVVIDVYEPHSCFPKIDQSVLAGIVKQKNLDQLGKYDGIEGLACSLETNLESGISGDLEDVSRRSEAFGSNTYRRPPAKSLLYLVWEALRDPTILILLACGALLLGFGIKEHGLKDGWYDGGSILVATLLLIAISAISKFWQAGQFVKLTKVRYNNIQADAVRNGRLQQVSISEIMVGDVVWLKSGDQVPADGLFIDGPSLLVDDHFLIIKPVDDQSSTTAETDPVEVDLNRNYNNPFLFSGTKVTAGNGRMLVTSVGMNTTSGEVMSTISTHSSEHAPLKYRPNKLTSSIGKVSLLVVILLHVVVLLIHYFTGNTKDKNGNTQYNSGQTKANGIINYVVGIISGAVTVLVNAVPGGLPLAVTLTLAYSMKRMNSDHKMVGKLSACETMGFTTTICTDKTGTLTLNQMKVTKSWLGQECIEERGTSSIATSVVELLQEGVGLNTTGSVNNSASGSEFEFSGSPTEKAILSWGASELNLRMEGLKESCEILQVEAFNLTKKRSGVLMRKKGENTTNVHWKGAPEMILPMCSHYYDISGNIKVLDNAERKKFDLIIQGMAASSLRCIAFAHKQVPEEENEEGKTQIDENYLNLLGLVGLTDPCRPGVKDTVEVCQSAGVKVKMITGDNISTAIAIATECGILKPHQAMESGAVVEGEEFRNYTPEERMEKVDKICVMARAFPQDKQLMVQCLKQKGDVVAFIGDGTNDAPALKEADIGLSMGISGTEVAKECSDIVILDDNFRSVASALGWGRCVYTNVQKFTQLLLTANVAATVINFVASVSTGVDPLSAVQFCWVNFIMNILGALALAAEKPTKELMEKPPVGRTKQLTTNVMWRNLLSQAFYQIAGLLSLQFKGEAIFKVSANVNETMIFNVFVLCQVFNAFVLWKLEKKNVFEGICKNKLFLVSIGVTTALQVVIVEFLKKLAGTDKLNWWQWAVCIGFALVSWPIGWVVKRIPVPKKLPVVPTSTANSGNEVLSGEEVLSGDEVTNSGEEVLSGDEVTNPNSGDEVLLGNEVTNPNSGDMVLSGNEVTNSGDEDLSGDEVLSGKILPGEEVLSGNEVLRGNEVLSGEEVLAGDEGCPATLG
ncbi:hypothetical protein RHGRI_003497 [Rhododendron griersonianum]|uniref:Calcium-transporting ATPase n=1 Tax=Rhododendron griersonianum TaxID=479676 RepID=A0AAV6L6D3_9ERIC|nr:hypothetical protein RHGRI_003497 [Rhododendron griersonianum]